MLRAGVVRAETHRRCSGPPTLICGGRRRVTGNGKNQCNRHDCLRRARELPDTVRESGRCRRTPPQRPESRARRGLVPPRFHVKRSGSTRRPDLRGPIGTATCRERPWEQPRPPYGRRSSSEHRPDHCLGPGARRAVHGTARHGTARHGTARHGTWPMFHVKHVRQARNCGLNRWPLIPDRGSGRLQRLPVALNGAIPIARQLPGMRVRRSSGGNRPGRARRECG